MTTLRNGTTVLVVAALLTLTGCATTVAPPSDTTPVRSTPSPIPPSDTTETTRPTSGPYDTGEAVGESAREFWEASKEFGRGVLDGFQK